MAAPPPLSVLLPVRNAEAYLPEALASLEQQTFGDFEVVAVDDGSSDASGAMLQEAALRDRRFRVFSQAPSGIVPALERARSQARGKYLARMDADDVALPDRFLLQMEVARQGGVAAVVGARVRYFPREGLGEGSLRYEAWINDLTTHEAMVRDLFVECPLPHPTLLLRAELLDLVGGYRAKGWPEDYDLVFRLWEAGARFAKGDQVLLLWRERPDRLSRRAPAYTPQAFLRCKVHFLLRTRLAGSGPPPPVLVWGAGPVGKAFARELLAQGGRIAAFVDLDPRKIGQTIHGAPVVAPARILDRRGVFCVAAVGQAGAREEIRKALADAGWREGEEFVAVA